jgi:hypothetical protein
MDVTAEENVLRIRDGVGMLRLRRKDLAVLLCFAQHDKSACNTERSRFQAERRACPERS